MVLDLRTAAIWNSWIDGVKSKKTTANDNYQHIPLEVVLP